MLDQNIRNCSKNNEFISKKYIRQLEGLSLTMRITETTVPTLMSC